MLYKKNGQVILGMRELNQEFSIVILAKNLLVPLHIIPRFLFFTHMPKTYQSDSNHKQLDTCIFLFLREVIFFFPSCIREYGSTLYVGLARAVSPTNTNFRLTFLLTRLKAVATDFEVVRPGSGCGLFNVGVVCLM